MCGSSYFDNEKKTVFGMGHIFQQDIQKLSGSEGQGSSVSVYHFLLLMEH